MRQEFRDRAEQEAQLEEQLDRIAVSTLSTAPFPFEQVAVLWGVQADDEADALRELKMTAYAEECDAVIGVGFCAVAGHNEFGGIRAVRFLAYGTGIQWTVDTDDSDDSD